MAMDGVRTRTGRWLNFLANGVGFGMPNDGWAWRSLAVFSWNGFAGPAPCIGRRPREAPPLPASAAVGAPLKRVTVPPFDTPPIHAWLAVPRACLARAYDASEAMMILARAGIGLPVAPTPADDRNSKR